MCIVIVVVIAATKFTIVHRQIIVKSLMRYPPAVSTEIHEVCTGLRAIFGLSQASHVTLDEGNEPYMHSTTVRT